MAQHDYPKALNLSTYFLGAQRSGDNNSWIHEASHTEDGSALSPQVDLTGVGMIAETILNLVLPIIGLQQCIY